MSAECGTIAGYHTHIRWKEKTCDSCRLAAAAYERDRAAARRKKFIQIERALVAELYLNAPISLQERLERELGRKKVDEMVEVFDKGAE